MAGRTMAHFGLGYKIEEFGSRKERNDKKGATQRSFFAIFASSRALREII